MSAAKAVSVTTMASSVSLLCFETGGLVGEFNIELGTQVAAFDYSTFYGILGSMPTVAGHPARILYDFLQIQAFVKPFTLVSLRAEGYKAALSKAVNGRANAFYAKYANAAAVIARTREGYSSSVTGSKPVRLEVLSRVSDDQMQQLRDAYLNDGRTSVVKSTNSVLKSQADSKNLDYLAMPKVFTPPGAGDPVTLGGSDPIQAHSQMVTEKQDIATTDYAYRVPYLENIAQYERAQISLIDEQYSQFMFEQNLPYLEAIYANELSSIDSDLYRLQIAYLNTILMSPVAGTVTGVYKNPGEAVTAGEPVIRIEDNSSVLLVAHLVYRGRIAVGSSVAVTTALFDAPGATTISGTVVSVRGLLADEQWEVVIKCKNLDGAGKPILPLGYRFDYDHTTVAVS